MKNIWLSEILKDKGLTHQEVADGVGIDRAYFTQIVNGYRRPSPNVAQKLGSFLGFNWTIFYNKICGEKPQKTGTE